MSVTKKTIKTPTVSLSFLKKRLQTIQLTHLSRLNLKNDYTFLGFGACLKRLKLKLWMLGAAASNNILSFIIN